MIKVSDIYNFIDELAPFEYAKAGDDNVGLLVGDMDSQVNSVLLALDITNAVVAEAAKEGAQLVISHHPVIFDPLYSLQATSPVYGLVKEGVAAICAHTNLDMAKGGISDIMAEMLMVTPCEVIEAVSQRAGEKIGFGKVCKLSTPHTPSQLAKRAQAVFGNTVVRYTEGVNKQITRIGLCSGAGGSIAGLAVSLGCDAYITGDVKHDQFIDALNLGITLIDAGHYHTEVIFAEYIKRMLNKKFPQLEVKIAESCVDPVKYIV